MRTETERPSLEFTCRFDNCLRREQILQQKIPTMSLFSCASLNDFGKGFSDSQALTAKSASPTRNKRSPLTLLIKLLKNELIRIFCAGGHREIPRMDGILGYNLKEFADG